MVVESVLEAVHSSFGQHFSKVAIFCVLDLLRHPDKMSFPLLIINVAYTLLLRLIIINIFKL